MKARTSSFLLALLLTACSGGGGSSGDSGPRQTNPVPDPVVDDLPELPDIQEELAALSGLSFDEFVDGSFMALLRRTPETAVTLSGIEVPLLLNPLSQQSLTETYDLLRGIRDQLADFDTGELNESQLRTHALYQYYLSDQLAGEAYSDFGYPGSFFLTGVPASTERFFTDLHPMSSLQDLSDYNARLRLVDDKFDDLMDNMESAAANGVLMPLQLLEPSVTAHAGLSTGNVDSHPYMQAMLDAVESLELTATQSSQYLDEARETVENEIMPAYASLADLLRQQRPDAPVGIGVNEHPGGEAFYLFALGHHTSAQLSPEEVADMGRQQLSRIHEEMRSLFEQLGYPGSDSISANLLRAEQAAGYLPAASAIATYEQILAEAQSRLSDAFDVMPLAPLEVRSDPIGGFYIPPAVDGTRPGVFYAGDRTHARMRMRSLAYHEGVPGHHLQIALAQENATSLPQQHITFTAFVEGWALYAERLASELGWYDDDPLSDLGRLQYEAFRAARLVVDPGIHTGSLSFVEAVDYLAANTGFSRGFAEGQIIRYAAWPGQAASYMTGMLFLLECRRPLESEPDFSLQDFHGKLLGAGARPLTLLESEC